MPKVWNARSRPHPPEGAVYVGRPTRWGNPYKIGEDGPRAEVIIKYERWICEGIEKHGYPIEELRGKDLICWCAPLPCHADVLLRLANQGGNDEENDQAT